MPGTCIWYLHKACTSSQGCLLLQTQTNPSNPETETQAKIKAINSWPSSSCALSKFVFDYLLMSWSQHEVGWFTLCPSDAGGGFSPTGCSPRFFHLPEERLWKHKLKLGWWIHWHFCHGSCQRQEYITADVKPITSHSNVVAHIWTILRLSLHYDGHCVIVIFELPKTFERIEIINDVKILDELDKAKRQLHRYTAAYSTA